MDENTATEELQRSMSELDISEDNDSPSGERWDPVGANNGDDDDFALEYKHQHGMESHCSEMEKLRMLEEEQEMLNSSLIALTTHFAQVQFRLKQICDAPTDKKEELLKELEEFAFRGIPDIQSNLIFNTRSSSPSSPSHRHDSIQFEDKEADLKMEMQRNKQKELICQLKSQLEDLEKYAYETGAADLPQSIVLERQNLIINHLKEKLNFNVEDFSKLSADDLRWQVDFAINQIVSPLKMKEQLITQLKTQITDLERFINYLQGEVSTETLACTCACPVHTNGPTQNYNAKKSFQKASMSENTTSLSTVRKVVALLHMYIMSQMGCGSQRSHRVKKKDTLYGWRDLRTRLDIAVEHVLETIAESEYCSSRGNMLEDISYNSDSDSAANQYDAKVTLAVRKHLAICIRDLMQHGTTTDATVNSVVPFVGCFAQRTYSPSNFMHAWEIILKYYEIKNGHRYNSSPAQKLSQSFNLDLNGGQMASSKQNLLITIGNIITMHTPYKRSFDSNFKAFICAALNANKLVTWLKLILQCQYLLENYYMPWSYVIKTGFQDAFHTLDKLTKHKFDLPIDLAIQQFQNIKEAF
ncbi:hypothetical protein TSAR_010612 [Trichomalopsis sarcophagae]|uniref:RUN domain-containing protein n=1 Tax=Trichomalopsis sarcophagae TaxID=543379 RepID=A0A232F7Q4_9HYME|nr:hypothetical protein TSAR_010612 [Trichomalopsis sarcophagae]